MPKDVPTFRMPLSGAEPKDLISGLIAGMHLVSEIANVAGRNIAKPVVSTLGRSLYYANLDRLITPPLDSTCRGESSKYEVLGAHWPSSRNSGKIRRAREATELAFREQKFRSIVFDYDGTLCSSNDNDRPPSAQIVRHIKNLLDAGVIVGVASGRGGSIAEHLTKSIPENNWKNVRLGLYNGGWIGRLGEPIDERNQPNEFLIHAKRIVTMLQSYGVPIALVRMTAPYQLSVRFEPGVSTESMWFVVVDAFRQAGLQTDTVVRSKHSIDVLSRGVSKSHLVAQIVRDELIDPYEVVTVGDLGAWPGNDASLLQHKFSLSVDLPSRRLDRGWKLAPQHKRDVDATLWYLDRLKIDCARFSFDFTEDPS